MEPFSLKSTMFDFKSGVRFVRGIVKDVKPQKLILDDGTEVPYGLLVWSTGVGPSSFVSSLDLPKAPGGRLVHQDHSSHRPFFFFLLNKCFFFSLIELALTNGCVYRLYKMCLQLVTAADISNPRESQHFLLSLK